MLDLFVMRAFHFIGRQTSNVTAGMLAHRAITQQDAHGSGRLFEGSGLSVSQTSGRKKDTRAFH